MYSTLHLELLRADQLWDSPRHRSRVALPEPLDVTAAPARTQNLRLDVKLVRGAKGDT